MRLARGSGRYLGPTLALLVLLVASAPWTHAWFRAVAVVVAAALLFMLWFFRDPERVPAGPGVLSPADGKVLAAVDGPHGPVLTIFMTPASVHVNRSPLDGRVTALTYRRGSHVPAFTKESERNERLDIDLDTPAGPVKVALIAGTVARRIHPYIAPGNAIKRGDRIGLIAFGSRCELGLPPGSTLRVGPGVWVKAGETPVADEVQS